MNFLRLTGTILFGFIGVHAFTQEQPDYSSILKGEWVVMESLLTSEIESPHISSYFKYEFTGDGIVYYASNEFERGRTSWYKLAGNKIDMMGYTFTIQLYEDDQLQIETQINRPRALYTSTLVRKEKYDRLWKLRGGTGQVVKSNPVFKGNFHLYDFVFSNYTSADKFAEHSLLQIYQPSPIPPKEDIFLRVDLIVDPNGNVAVTNVRSSPEMNQKRTARIKKKIENTSGYWIPANTEGKNETQSFTLTFVSRGKTSLQLKDRAIQHFKMAYQHFQKADYLGAIQRCTDAITLDQTKFQFYVLRAVCNIKLTEIDKYCKDVFMANSLNPFVSLENTEVVNGEVLQIKCGEK